MTSVQASGSFTDGISMPWDDWGESFRALAAQSIESFAEASWEFLKGSFTAGSFAVEGGAQDWWIAVIGGSIDVSVGGEFSHTVEYPGMLNVMVVAMLPILFILTAFQVVLSIARSSTAGMLRAFAASILAVPMTYIIGGVMFVALQGTDGLAQAILEMGSGETGGDDVGVAGIYRLFGMMYDPEANGGDGGVLMDASYEAWALAGLSDEPGKIILPWVIAFGLLVICAILMLMMIFRTVAVLVLTMFTPIAVFSLSFEAAKAIFMKWAGLVVALLLAKPVAASIVKFGITMASIGSDWVQLVAGAVLIIVAAAMPLMMLAIVSFITPESSRALESAAVGAAGAGQRRVSGGARSGTRMVGGAARTAVRGGRTVGRSVSRASQSAGRRVNRVSGAGRGRK